MLIPLGAFIITNQLNVIVSVNDAQVAGLMATNQINSFKSVPNLDGEFFHDENLKSINYILDKKTIPAGITQEKIGEIQIESPLRLKIESVITGVLPQDLKIGLMQNNIIVWFYDERRYSIDTEILLEKSTDIFFVTESRVRINYPLRLNLSLQY